MIRVKRSNIRLKKRKKIAKFCKKHKQLNTARYAKEQQIQSLKFSYINRKLNKRNFNILWIVLINTLLNQLNLKYSTFIQYLKKNSIFLTKQMILYLAYSQAVIFIGFINIIKNGV